MSENEEKNKEQDSYELKHSDKENENGIKLHFFEKAERDLHKVEEVIQKIERMREQLRTKIMQLQQNMVSKIMIPKRRPSKMVQKKLQILLRKKNLI